jgi:hypothetical protein
MSGGNAEPVVTTPGADDVAEWLRDAVATKAATMVEMFRCFGDRPVDDRITVWENLSASDAGALGQLAERMVKSAERQGRSIVQGQAVTYLFVAKAQTGRQVDQVTIRVPSGAPTQTSSSPAALEVRDMASALSHVLTEHTKMATQLVKAIEGRDDSLSRQLQTALLRVSELEKEARLNMLAQQRFVLLQMERVDQQARLKREERRDDLIFGKLAAILPLGLNRLMGGGPGKGAPAADAILRQFFTSLTKEDIEQLMRTGIDDEKKVLIGELYMSYMQAEASAKARGAAAGEAEDVPLNGTANGAAPAGKGEAPS